MDSGFRQNDEFGRHFPHALANPVIGLGPRRASAALRVNSLREAHSFRNAA